MRSQQTTLTECRECAGQVSAYAPSCPHCGAARPALTTLPREADGRMAARFRDKEETVSTDLATCRECRGQVSPSAGMCPHCGAQFPARKRNPYGGEWKSERTIKGRPLVHVAWGRDPLTGKMRCAKGVIAIGQLAKGDIAIGQFAFGKYFALGQFAASFGIGIGEIAAAPLCLAMFGIGIVTTAFIGIGLKLVCALGIDLNGFIIHGHAAATQFAPEAPTHIEFPGR